MLLIELALQLGCIDHCSFPQCVQLHDKECCLSVVWPAVAESPAAMAGPDGTQQSLAVALHNFVRPSQFCKHSIPPSLHIVHGWLLMNNVQSIPHMWPPSRLSGPASISPPDFYWTVPLRPAGCQGRLGRCRAVPGRHPQRRGDLKCHSGHHRSQQHRLAGASDSSGPVCSGAAGDGRVGGGRAEPQRAGLQR